MAFGIFFLSAALTARNSPELHFRFINSFIQSSAKVFGFRYLFSKLETGYSISKEVKTFLPEFEIKMIKVSFLSDHKS